MKEHMADWRIHALAFVLTVIAEFIGTKKFSFGPLSFSLFPMLYVLILGAILGIAKMIPQKMMTEASMIVYGFLSYEDGKVRIPNRELMKNILGIGIR